VGCTCRGLASCSLAHSATTTSDSTFSTGHSSCETSRTAGTPTTQHSEQHSSPSVQSFPPVHEMVHFQTLHHSYKTSFHPHTPNSLRVPQLPSGSSHARNSCYQKTFSSHPGTLIILGQRHSWLCCVYRMEIRSNCKGTWETIRP
jgi:hypothetical protein